MARYARLVFTCFSLLSDPENHGSEPATSLQVAPFQSENNSVWIGYHDQPSRKYLGVFPSFDEVIGRCKRNASAGGANTSFPRFRTDARVSRGIARDPDRPGHYIKHVCCAACQDHVADCERLTLNILPVVTDDNKYCKVFLVMYRFYLRGEQMIALLHHSGHGKYSFQKTDGTLTKKLAMDSRHQCLRPSQPPSSLGDSEGDSESSSLTQFDCLEDEDTTHIRESPRVSLRSNQRHQLQEEQEREIAVVKPAPQTPYLPQQISTSQALSRGSVVIELSDEDEPSPIKQEQSEQPERSHPSALVPYKTPTPTPASTPSIAYSEDMSFTSHFGPDPLAEEYGRIIAQIFQEYSMRVFTLPEVTDIFQRMKQAVKANDRAALCRAYGALQAFLITVE